MRKNIIIGLIMAGITLPLFASLITISSTTGFGLALAAGSTTPAKFAVNANQTTDEGTTTVNGDFFLGVSTTPGGTGVRGSSGSSDTAFPWPSVTPWPHPSATPRPSQTPGPSATPRPSPPPHFGTGLRMHVTGYAPGSTPNAVQLSGPATLRVASATGTQTYEGTATATLVSNRHPDEMGDPDTLEAHFVPTNSGDPSLDFSGTVTQGDIRISETDSY